MPASAPRRPSPASKDMLGTKASEVADGESIVVPSDGSVQLGDGAYLLRTVPAPQSIYISS